MNSEKELIQQINKYKQLNDRYKLLEEKDTSEKGKFLLIVNIIAILLAAINMDMILIVITFTSLWTCLDLATNSPYSKYRDVVAKITSRKRNNMILAIITLIAAIIKLLSGDSNVIMTIINYTIAMSVFIAIYKTYKELGTDYELMNNTKEDKEATLEEIYETKYFKDMVHELNESINDSQVSILNHTNHFVYRMSGARFDCDITYAIKGSHSELEPIDLIINNLTQINELQEKIKETVESLKDVDLKYVCQNAYVNVYDGKDRFDEYGNTIPLKFKLSDLNKINKENSHNAELNAIALTVNSNDLEN